MFSLALTGVALYMTLQSQKRQMDIDPLTKLAPGSNKLRSTFAANSLNAPLKRKFGGTADTSLLKRKFTGTYNDTVQLRRKTADIIYNVETPIDYRDEYGAGSRDVLGYVPIHMRVKKKGIDFNTFKRPELANMLQGQRRLGRSSKITRSAFYNKILPKRRDIQPTVAFSS